MKQFCDGENIKRIRSTPNSNTGSRLVERTIRTIESLTRSTLEDGLTFKEIVQLEMKRIRQTPHSTLNVSFFQMHLGRKSCTSIINLIGEPSCLLSYWKKTLTKYILAQRTELPVFTINDSDGEFGGLSGMNDTRKIARSVGQNFKGYKLYENETEPIAIKCRFKTDKVQTASKETVHTITTGEEKVLHKI